MARLLHRLSRWKPDVIHFQWMPFPAVDGFFLQWFRKIARLVLTVHDTEPFQGSPSTKFQLIGLMSALERFDHYIVHTQHSKEVLIRQLALPEHRVTTIPHGVFTYYRELVSDLGEASQTPQLARKKRILFFGVIKPYKGVDILLEAFARLPGLILKDTILQIVGYPKVPVEPLYALAQRLGIQNRVFWDLRFVEEKEVARYFSKADIVVLPYRRIDQSGVLMVALAFGKPIVASRLGGFSEILSDGVNGFLVEPGNVKSLAQALARILGDDSLSFRMTVGVKRLIDGEMSWNNIAKKTVFLYQTILRA